MKLDKAVRKAIIETKQKKESLLIEEKIITSRIMMIVEDVDNLKNFEKLPQEEQFRIGFALMKEFAYLNESGLLNEQLGSILSNLFGGSYQTLVQPLINSLLSAVGFPEGFLRKSVVAFFSENPVKVFQAFSDCKVMTGLVAQALVNAMVMEIQSMTNTGGMGYDLIRNTLLKSIEDMDFVKKLEGGLEETVCGLFDKYTSKAQNVVNTLKSQGQPTTQTAQPAAQATQAASQQG